MADPERLNATRARQAFAGRPVLYVLIGGLALLALAMVVLMSSQSSDRPQSASGQAPTTAERTGTTSTTPPPKPAK